MMCVFLTYGGHHHLKRFSVQWPTTESSLKCYTEFLGMARFIFIFKFLWVNVHVCNDSVQHVLNSFLHCHVLMGLTDWALHWISLPSPWIQFCTPSLQWILWALAMRPKCLFYYWTPCIGAIPPDLAHCFYFIYFIFIWFVFCFIFLIVD